MQPLLVPWKREEFFQIIYTCVYAAELGRHRRPMGRIGKDCHAVGCKPYRLWVAASLLQAGSRTTPKLGQDQLVGSSGNLWHCVGFGSSNIKNQLDGAVFLWIHKNNLLKSGSLAIIFSKSRRIAHTYVNSHGTVVNFLPKWRKFQEQCKRTRPLRQIPLLDPGYCPKALFTVERALRFWPNISNCLLCLPFWAHQQTCPRPSRTKMYNLKPLN
jgi:hypothetical protein